MGWDRGFWYPFVRIWRKYIEWHGLEVFQNIHSIQIQIILNDKSYCYTGETQDLDIPLYGCERDTEWPSPRVFHRTQNIQNWKLKVVFRMQRILISKNDKEWKYFKFQMLKNFWLLYGKTETGNLIPWHPFVGNLRSLRKCFWFLHHRQNFPFLAKRSTSFPLLSHCFESFLFP